MMWLLGNTNYLIIYWIKGGMQCVCARMCVGGGDDIVYYSWKWLLFFILWIFFLPGGERGHVIATLTLLIDVTRCRADGAQGQIEDWWMSLRVSECAWTDVFVCFMYVQFRAASNSPKPFDALFITWHLRSKSTFEIRMLFSFSFFFLWGGCLFILFQLSLFSTQWLIKIQTTLLLCYTVCRVTLQWALHRICFFIFELWWSRRCR